MKVSDTKSNPWLEASFFHRIFHSWVYRLVILANKRDLDETDLYKCIPKYQSKVIGEKLNKEWKTELKRREVHPKYRPNLVKAILRANKRPVILYLSLCFLQNCVLRLIQPLILGEIVRYYSNGQQEGAVNVGFCFIILWLSSIVFSYLGNSIFHGGSEVGVRVRIGCSNLLFAKVLNLSTAAMSEIKLGKMINMMSNNFNRFEATGKFFPFILISPIHLMLSGIILWKLMGLSTTAGSLIFVLQLLFQIIMGKVTANLRLKTSKITDERIRILNESVSAMKVIKMYTWENKMVHQVETTRKKEISRQLLQSTTVGLSSDMAHLFGKIALFVTIVVYYSRNGITITPINLFIAISFFENLRFSFRLFSYSIIFIAECLTIVKRLEEFLLLEDKPNDQPNNNAGMDERGTNRAAIITKNVVASWSEKSKVLAVQDLSLTIEQGELVAIVGPVGAGKTSLLQLLMGEMHISKGDMKVNGKIAYVPQEAWLHTGTIKENVLLFSDITENAYLQALQVCTLDRDIAMMELGDKTLVGEKGALLSGGQKARVNLARALCSNSDIYLLDDPLSAVDASVGKNIFQNCIVDYLKGKTRVLVTHQVQHLRDVDQILVLKEGKCIANGTYDELTEKGINLETLVTKEPDLPFNEDILMQLEKELSESLAGNLDDGNEKRVAAGENHSKIDEISKNCHEKSAEVKKGNGSKGTTAKTLWKYIKSAGGIPALCLIFTLTVLAQTFFNGTDIYLSAWTSARDCPVTNSSVVTAGNRSSPDYCIPFLKTKDSYFFAYVVIVSCLFFLWMARIVAFYALTNRAAKRIHIDVIRKLFKAPMSFFEKNPSGRILNRVTRDVGIMDDIVAYILCESLMISVLELGYLFVIVYYFIMMIIPAGLLVIFCVLLGYFYVKPSHEFQKLDSSCSSPVYSHLASTVLGLHAIRSFGGQEKFREVFDDLLDKQTSATITNLTSSSFYQFGIEVASVCFLTCVHVMVYFSSGDGSSAGLALSSSLQIALSLQYVALLVLNSVSLLVSVERVLEYRKLPNEQEFIDPKNDVVKPKENWPTDGVVKFDNVSLYYDYAKPPSLRNISFEIQPGESVGIVGRTGAGKSSIIAALLRLREPEGRVIIDNLVTKDISLTDLRGKISVIPQDPVLFSGPLRQSIDPDSKCPDFKLWNALKQVQLDATIRQLPQGLDTILKDGGSNFSVGQRQLLCLARTILLNNKILVLDEATANIDPRTDNLIQQTVKDSFKNCTTLTIAHRLDTIMDCSKVMVLDMGTLIEYDDPYILLKNSNSAFSSLVNETGCSVKDYLVNKAKGAYIRRKSSVDVISSVSALETFRI